LRLREQRQAGKKKHGATPHSAMQMVETTLAVAAILLPFDSLPVE
jgi:hypothetical protein